MMKFDQVKLLCAVVIGVLFFVVSSPAVYKFTDKLFGKALHLADAKGCPTTLGLIVHAIVFVLLLALVQMLLKVKC